ncbi:MAG: 23S rRNA (guanosine(2251)-2'-O)-methyltransferase RlmB [Bacteroidota bacterium]|nr:23S rRNA (guanosine(2251)-2'-O)-methyltransferase RlmB [Bacteroidota bacterium]
MGRSEVQTIITGRNAVREALEREPLQLEHICIRRGARGLYHLRRIADKAQVQVKELPESGLTRIAGSVRHQGVIAVRAALAYQDSVAMLARIAPDLDTVKRKCPRLLLLDGIQDPRNFGAILRTAVAAGVAGVIVPSRKMAPLSDATLRASSGTAARISIARVNSLIDIIWPLKERGFYVYGAAGAGESLWETNWQRPVALVLGSEGRGLQAATARECDQLVSVPLPGDAQSLNVAVAAGILLFESLRVT